MHAALGIRGRQIRLRTARKGRQPRPRHPHRRPALLQRLRAAPGPQIPVSGVISIFCERIAAGAPVTIFGDGQQTRDFIYVSDVVAALLAGMALRPANAPVFNVCTGVATSVEALGRLIADLAGKTFNTQTGPPRGGEIRHSLGVPARADTALGLSGRVPLRTGLGQVLAWVAGSAG